MSVHFQGVGLSRLSNPGEKIQKHPKNLQRRIYEGAAAMRGWKIWGRGVRIRIAKKQLSARKTQSNHV